jgi:hypothetical protein
MYTFLLQDFTTLQNTAVAATTIVQSEDGWLEIEGFQDAVVWWHVAEYTGSVTVNVETSPTTDESLFTTLSTAGVGAPGNFAGISRARGNPQPLARYLRWKVVPPASGAWSLTFRVFVSLNPAPRTA